MATSSTPAAALTLRLLLLLGVALGAWLLVPAAWLLAHSFRVPYGIQEKEINNSIGMKLILIPAGKFLMGSPKDEKGRDDDDDETQHEVTISKPFYLGKYEVTRGQFRKFVEAEGYETEAEQKNEANTWKKNERFAQTDEHPVVCVTWNDAKKFCAWMKAKEKKDYRLPTEAEWEYACRAWTSTRFSYGDDPGYTNLTNYAWYLDGTTHPVGQKLPNPWGLYDMHGNVWEWCQDWYRPISRRDCP
jgi:formylglycine-generating enzyme required for sulfatase activity